MDVHFHIPVIIIAMLKNFGISLAISLVSLLVVLGFGRLWLDNTHHNDSAVLALVLMILGFIIGVLVATFGTLLPITTTVLFGIVGLINVFSMGLFFYSFRHG